MRRSTFLTSLGAATLAFGMTVPTQAAIDFTDGNWGTNNPRIIGGVTVTLSAFDGAGSTSFTETAFDGDSTQCGPLGLACTSDGIGIVDDEVSFGVGDKTDVERLVVTFSEAVNIAEIIFLDLFAAPDDGTTNDETTQMQMNGNGAGVVFTGTATDTTGFFVGTTSNATLLSDPNAFVGVTQIEFFADTAKFSSSENSEFALAGIRLVPIPAALPLLGSALAALVVVGRRRKKLAA